MLAQAAARNIRSHVVRMPSTASRHLTCLRLCASPSRRHSAIASSATPLLESRWQQAISTSPRSKTRSLATATDLAPAPTPPSFNPFASPWQPNAGSPKMERLQPWHTDPVVVRDTTSASPGVRRNFGMGNDPVELHQNLYACLRVGRLDSASSIIERLALIYMPSAPEIVDAHNSYLQALLEMAQADPKAESMATIENWYNLFMVRRNIEPNAHTFVTLARAAINFLDEPAMQQAVHKYLARAHEYGPSMVEDINASPDFSDEEWEALIRLQPETYDDPPSVEEMHALHIDSPAGREQLAQHGFGSHSPLPIRSVSQKGYGLESLKHALTMFAEAGIVPYPHDMEGTKEEKDYAYAYARQVRVEADSMSAAVARWKLEDEKLQDVGIHGVMKSRPIQSLMYTWFKALVPLFEEQLQHCARVMSEPLAENLNDDARTYGPWLERCTPESLAAMTVARAVQSCIHGRKEDNVALKVASLAVALGSDIQDHLRSNIKTRRDAFLKKQRRETREKLVSQLAKPAAPESEAAPTLDKPLLMPLSFDGTDMPLPAKTKLGASCLALLLQSAKIVVTVDDPKTGETLSKPIAAFHHELGFYKGKKLGYLIPHHELTKKLGSERVTGIQTVRLPMVIEPRPWSGFEEGAYYTVPQKFVRQKNGDAAQRAYAEAAINNGDLTQMMKGIDVLGKVPWQINPFILEVMTQVWNSGEGVGELVAAKIELERPPEPPSDANTQVKAKWNKEIQTYENTLSGFHSQRCFQNFQLETARSYVNEQKIFFPHSVDFRGRAYPVPPVLNHIGPDVSRGLLRFARGKELGTVGLQWLKIHIANLYGFDKASLTEREQFAMDNINEIYDSAADPLGGRRWWLQAEDPWQCLACCLELQNALDSPDPTRYLSQQPVHQDGTCNGLQHYAALGGDHAGARQVNLEPSDRPQDIYTGVAELVKEMVSKDAAKGHAIACFVDGHITRKVVKRTVMTNVYGVTFMGAKVQVHDELLNLFPNFKESPGVRSLELVSLYIVSKIFEALGKIFNGAQEIQYWLGECGERITTSLSAEQVHEIQSCYEEEPTTPYDPRFIVPKAMTQSMKARMKKRMENFKTAIIWTTPLRMPIVQPYRKDSTQTIPTKIQDISVLKRTTAEIVDKRKQLQAFPPNFIHSLDATHMILSALSCAEKGLDFAAVHDSFWTHACDIPQLNTILRDAFVRMHSEDIMERLAAEFSTRYAGAMYRVSIRASAPVSQKISEWRANQRKINGESLANLKMRAGAASFVEVALESKRQKLLRSEDPNERKKGANMVTPTSLWLAHQDPQSISSFRLHLIGEMTGKKAKQRQTEVKDKVLSAEAETVKGEVDEAVPMVESTVTVMPDAGAAKDQVTEGSEKTKKKEKTVAQLMSDVTTIQVWVPLTFPPIPKKGSWDVSRLRESKYFFS